MERLKTLIATDEFELKKGIEVNITRMQHGTLLAIEGKVRKMAWSSLKEIVKIKPDIILLRPGLLKQHRHTMDEFLGFTKQLRKRLPKTTLVVQSSFLSHEYIEEVFASGVNGLILNEGYPYEKLGKALESIAKGMPVPDPLIKQNPITPHSRH